MPHLSRTVVGMIISGRCIEFYKFAHSNLGENCESLYHYRVSLTICTRTERNAHLTNTRGEIIYLSMQLDGASGSFWIYNTEVVMIMCAYTSVRA